MKMNRYVIIVAIIGLSTVFMAARYGDPPCYDPSGTWVLCHTDEVNPGLPDGPYGLVKIIPLNSNDDTWVLDADGINGNPGDVGFDPSYRYTNWIGKVVKTGRNQFESKTIGSILDGEGNVVVQGIVYTSFYFLSCDYFYADVTFHIYLPTQDKNNDGIPDWDEEPVGGQTTNWYYSRTDLIPPLN